MAKTQEFKAWLEDWNWGDATDKERWSHLDLINGWTDPGALTMLNTIVRDFFQPGDNYLEIGTYCGKSLCGALQDNQGEAQVIDPFGLVLPDGDAIEAAWRRNVAAQGVNDRVQLHRSTSQSFAGKLPLIGLYYYDGSHEVGDTYHGLTTFEHHLSDRAIIIVDDCAMPEVAPDIDKYVNTRPQVTLLGQSPFAPYNQAVMIFER